MLPENQNVPLNPLDLPRATVGNVLSIGLPGPTNLAMHGSLTTLVGDEST